MRHKARKIRWKNVKHADLNRRSENQSAVAQRISKRLAVRSASSLTRNVASVPAKTVPFFGATVVLAMVAVDIHDTCESMKDINELKREFGHEQEDLNKVCGMKVPML